MVDFEEIQRLVRASSPKLLVGAVEVQSGEFKVFRNAEVTAETIFTSCALPMMFRAVRLGDDEVYWDGLFSQNPPIRDFMREFPDAATKPDEIWLIQISPSAASTSHDLSRRYSTGAGRCRATSRSTRR